MTAEARTTEGKNLRVNRAGPWDDFTQRRGSGGGDGRSAAGQGKATFGAMRCSALQCGAGGLVERRPSGRWDCRWTSRWTSK